MEDLEGVAGSTTSMIFLDFLTVEGEVFVLTSAGVFFAAGAGLNLPVGVTMTSEEDFSTAEDVEEALRCVTCQYIPI